MDTTPEFISHCLEACDHLGIKIHMVDDNERDMQVGHGFCKRGDSAHLYLADWMDSEAVIKTLLNGLSQVDFEDAYLPPVVREAIEVEIMVSEG